MEVVHPTFHRHAALAEAIFPSLRDHDLAHDIGHVTRVYRWALALAPEAHADPDLAGAAALVHDLVMLPKNDPATSTSATLASLAAVPLLERVGYSEQEAEAIARAVSASSWSKGLPPANEVGLALMEADRLDAIGAIGIARVFACGEGMRRAGSAFWHEQDPWAEHGRACDDKVYSLDHFSMKLLRIAKTFTLPSAKTEAARRHAFLVAYLEELRNELSASSPLRAP